MDDYIELRDVRVVGLTSGALVALAAVWDLFAEGPLWSLAPTVLLVPAGVA